MARALIAAGVLGRARVPARDGGSSSISPSAASASIDLERLAELAREVLGERGGRPRRRPPAPLRRRCRRSTCRSSLLVGGSTGTGKSTVADRGGAPARDHARHVDRLHPPDDARVLLAGVHAVDPLLELRGRAGGRRRGDRRSDGRRLPRPDAATCCVGVEAAIRRALTEGWSMVLEGVHLVPGMVPAEHRGRARRPRRDRDRDEDVHRDALPRAGPADRRHPRDGQVPRPDRRHPAHADATSSSRAREDRRPGDRELRMSSGRSTEVMELVDAARPSALRGGRVTEPSRTDAARARGRARTARAVHVRELRARDRARGARRRALARPRRPGGGRGGGVLGRALRARVAADQRPGS